MDTKIMDWLKVIGISAAIADLSVAVSSGSLKVIAQQHSYEPVGNQEIIQKQRITFEQVQKDTSKSLRQAYLDQIIYENNFPYVERVVYDPQSEHMASFLRERGSSEEEIEVYKETVGEMHTPFNIFQMGKHIKIPIFVKASAFTNSLYQTDDDFKCSLIGHEVLHVKDMYFGMSLGKTIIDYKLAHYIDFRDLRIEVLFTIADYKAYNEEYKDIINEKYNVNSIFKKGIEIFIKKLETALYKYKKNYNSQLELSLINAALDIYRQR